MASMAGVVNTFSTQTSMAVPLNCDRTAVNKGKRDAYTVSRAAQTETERVFASWMGLRDRGIVLQVDPSPRLRLGTFNGGRAAPGSLVGQGGGAPPVSPFLRPPAPYADTNT